MKKNKTKFFASPFIMVGLIIMMVLMFGMWSVVLVAFLQGGNAVTSKDEMTKVFIGVTGVVVFSIITFFATSHKGFSVFEISDKGVKSSLFRVFRKIEIAWDDIYEIRCYGMITRWLFFSKTCLEGMVYNDIIKRKDVLQVECSKQMIELINSYTNKPIVNLPEGL